MKYILDGESYSVEIIKKNNKNIYVRVKDDCTIYVTASYFTTKSQIIRILDANKSFLRKSISNKKNKNKDENSVPFLGTSYQIIYSNLFNDVELIENKIYVKDEKLLQKWFLKQVKSIFKQHYDALYNSFNEEIPYYQLKFRNMKTRWGVCNRKSKTVTLNTRLIEYPLYCLDYVIIHELSHLVHFNHSSLFWQVVENHCPDYKKIRKILKD